MDTEDAFFADQFKDLPRSQRSALRRIVLGVQAMAWRECERGMAFSSHRAYLADQWRRRPHNVFFIDGARGSGKTYLLLTAQHFIEQLGTTDAGADKRAKDTRESLRQELSCFEHEHLRLFDLPQHIDGRRYQRTALVLPVVFPDDLEGASAMEAIFAGLRTLLETAPGKEADGGPRSTKDLDALRLKLSEGVARRWMFSRNLGVEAILNDSNDFTDFVRKRAHEAFDAHSRISEWRQFVNALLDVFGAAMLVVFLDDTDVRPSLTADILHSMRMFLTHPRIVTVIAGNSKAMRQSLVYDALGRLAEPMQSLNREDHPTGSAWRRIEREEIEQYLEKVLPRWGRHYLGQAAIERGARGGWRPPLQFGVRREGPRSDFESILGVDFDDFCRRMLESQRTQFFSVKGALALRYEESGVDIMSPAERAIIEGFIAWWRLRHVYADALAPKTARQMVTFERYYGDGVRVVDNPKRLAVALFESPENHALAHRFGDADRSVLEWLRHQEIASRWTGRRAFVINGSHLYEGAYSYDFLCYRLDLGIAWPVRVNEDSIVPADLLPRPVGASYVGAFFSLVDEVRSLNRFGVARSIRHAAIPANCIYMSDLRALPDTAFDDTHRFLPEGRAAFRGDGERAVALQWEGSLVHAWPRIYADDISVSATMRYLATWVFPALSGAREQDAVHSLSEPESGLFLAEEVAAWRRFAAARGRIGVSRALIEGSHARDSAETLLRPVRARYIALVTDLRRAWHAARILATSLTETDKGALGEGDAQKSLEVRATNDIYIARDRYRVLDITTLESLISMVPWLGGQLDWKWETNPVPYAASGVRQPIDDSELELLRSVGDAKTPRDRGQAEWKEFWAQRVQGRFDRRDNVFRPLFPAGQGGPDDEPVSVEARKARVARHVMLFLLGLEGAIPALVHTDIAARLYGENASCEDSLDTDAKGLRGRLAQAPGEAVFETLEKWEWFVASAAFFNARLREDVKDMLFYSRKRGGDVKEQEDWFEQRCIGDNEIGSAIANSELEVKFTFAPDISQVTLLGEPRGKPLPFGLERQAGIFPEIERHLFTAWCFIQMLRTALADSEFKETKTTPNGAKRTRRAKSGAK